MALKLFEFLIQLTQFKKKLHFANISNQNSFQFARLWNEKNASKNHLHDSKLWTKEFESNVLMTRNNIIRIKATNKADKTPEKNR